jgi:pimeloyl-ACP methyl ester carboxylesterase
MQRLLQAEELTTIEDAGHFLQEDQGELIGNLVADWLAEL